MWLWARWKGEERETKHYGIVSCCVFYALRSSSYCWDIWPRKKIEKTIYTRGSFHTQIMLLRNWDWNFAFVVVQTDWCWQLLLSHWSAKWHLEQECEREPSGPELKSYVCRLLTRARGKSQVTALELEREKQHTKWENRSRVARDGSHMNGIRNLHFA